MKRFTLLLATAIVAGSAFSEVLSPEAALRRVSSTNTTTARHIKSLNTVTPELLTTFTADNQPAVYLFGRSNDGGYLVLSADDSTDAILGYCDSGSLDVANMPPAMTYLLQSYADQIAYARAAAEQGVQPKAHVSPEREAIHPMCSTRWGLNDPFNLKAPNNYPAGCVAVALAQVLKYYEYPTKGTGTASYTWNNGTDASQTLSFDFDNTTFNWSRMLDSYDTDRVTTAQKNAVANLMYACGVTVSMNYKSGGSGAYAINVIKSSANYFKLDKSIRYYVRDYYGYDEWNDLIYDGLKNGGPVMLGGCINNILSSAYAHEYVCDGYSYDDMFHINWGWEGECDGYFRLNALESYSAGMNLSKYAYNYNQDAICYIKPAEDNSQYFEQMYCNGFSVQQASANLGGSITLNGGAINYTSAPLSGTLGIKISDINGELVQYVGSSSSFSNVALTSNAGNYSVTLPTDLTDGQYTITPVFKGSDNEWHKINVKAAAVQSYTMTVASGKATFTSDGACSLKVEDFSIDTPFYKTNSSADYVVPLRMSAKVSSDQEYYGKVAMQLYNSTGSSLIQTYSYVPVYIPKGETLDIEIYETSTTVTEGTSYKIALVDGSNNILTDKLDVTVQTGTPPTDWVATLDNPSIEDSDSVDPHDIHVKFDINCTSGYLFETPWLTVYDPENNIVQQWSLFPVSMVAGETRSYDLHLDFPAAVVGYTYRMYALTGASAQWLSTKAMKFTVGGERAGINDLPADDVDVVRTEYYNMQGVNLGADTPAPGLYIKAETLSNGERRTSRCIIR